MAINEATPVITPRRYRVLCQEAERQIGRTLSGVSEQKVKEAAVNATATVLNLLGVAMVPDDFPLEAVPDVEQQARNLEARREWVAGRDGYEDEKRRLGIPAD